MELLCSGLCLQNVKLAGDVLMGNKWEGHQAADVTVGASVVLVSWSQSYLLYFPVDGLGPMEDTSLNLGIWENFTEGLPNREFEVDHVLGHSGWGWELTDDGGENGGVVFLLASGHQGVDKGDLLDLFVGFDESVD